ncbi:hypothetical protein B566_EDAN016786 [Ephemera danica]|nr:hypothetical protein B566_EDAN016786 [Ephemera danica]
MHRLANGRVYYFSPPAPAAALATWAQARDYCTTHGMHLVILDTARENQLVLAQATALLMANGAGPGAWIGLRDISLLDFRWLLRDTRPAFIAFSAMPAGGGLCVNYLATAATSAAASWTTTACGGGPLAFICEMELPCSAVAPAINV